MNWRETVKSKKWREERLKNRELILEQYKIKRKLILEILKKYNIIITVDTIDDKFIHFMIKDEEYILSYCLHFQLYKRVVLPEFDFKYYKDEQIIELDHFLQKQFGE